MQLNLVVFQHRYFRLVRVCLLVSTLVYIHRHVCFEEMFGVNSALQKIPIVYVNTEHIVV